MARWPLSDHGAHALNNTASHSLWHRRRHSTPRTTRSTLSLQPPSSEFRYHEPSRSSVAEDARAALAEVGYPAVIKPTRSWVSNADSRTEVVSKAVLEESEAVRYVEELIMLGGSPVIQQMAHGPRESGNRLLRFTERCGLRSRRWHTAPPRFLVGCRLSARAYPCRPTWSQPLWLLYATSIWRVVARSNSGTMPRVRPLLMEINARLSGSVEVATRSGVPFPALPGSGRPVDFSCGVGLPVPGSRCVT